MSESLGEKLRQAREARGISISEVAEQTRISPIYIESIENDDYRNLPGGIFNKGFVKSFAKYVGINEQEALMDYSQLITQAQAQPEPEFKTYRPEVLTDDHSYSSSVPTIIVAVIILALMTGGVLFLVNYLRRPAAPVVSDTGNRPAANDNNRNLANTETSVPPAADFGTVEFRSVNKMTVLATVDSEAPAKTDIAPGSSATFNPKESITLNYLRWNAPSVALSINGKPVALPSAPLKPSDKDRIIFTITKDDLAQVLSTGAVAGTPPAETQPAPNASTTEPNSAAAPPSTKPVQTPKPAGPANTGAAATPKPQEPAKPKPTPARVIVVGNAPRPTP